MSWIKVSTIDDPVSGPVRVYMGEGWDADKMMISTGEADVIQRVVITHYLFDKITEAVDTARGK